MDGDPYKSWFRRRHLASTVGFDIKPDSESFKCPECGVFMGIIGKKTEHVNVRATWDVVFRCSGCKLREQRTFDHF